jgi:hypothetical protein
MTPKTILWSILPSIIFSLRTKNSPGNYKTLSFKICKKGRTFSTKHSKALWTKIWVKMNRDRNSWELLGECNLKGQRIKGTMLLQTHSISPLSCLHCLQLQVYKGRKENRWRNLVFSLRCELLSNNKMRIIIFKHNQLK